VRSRAAIAALLAMAGCAEAVAQEEAQPVPVEEMLPEGYPPKIGEVMAQLDGAPIFWETYDFSIGAFDASAFFGGEKAAPVFHLTGYPPGRPDVMDNRLRLEGRGAPAAGVLAGAVVELIDEDPEGPRLCSAGQAADVVLDRVSRLNSGYGHATGHFSARLCPLGTTTAKVTQVCQQISGRFETDFQYDMH
jgi:hypothetical protein